MKLQSLREFVLEQIAEDILLDGPGSVLARVENYAQFLSQPLQLSMFVPCDLEGNVLSDPNDKNCGGCETACDDCELKHNAWNEVRELVLFEGFEWNTAEFCDERMLELENESKVYLLYDCEDKNFQDSEDNYIKTIEDLIKYNLTLTPSAITKIKGV